jgi:predicted CoA-binding protein
MQGEGYRIVPVNPTYAGTMLLGEMCYPSLHDAAEHLALQGQKIDMVNCFRRSDAIRTIAEEAIDIDAICLWTQLGIVDDSAAEMAGKAGLSVIMDRCLKIEHSML